MRYIFATILGILDVVIFGPLETVLGFFGWSNTFSGGVIQNINQDHKDANWRREFLAQKQLERTTRNPFVNQNQSEQNSRNHFSTKVNPNPCSGGART